MTPQDLVARLNLTISGDPCAARTLVFTHGFGTDQTAWDAVAAAFASDYRIVRYDFAGAGRSDEAAFRKNQHRYLGLRAYADDLVAIADALALEGAVAVGHSMGGMISLLAAIDRPARFSRLVLVGASPRYLDDEGYRGGLDKPGLDEVYRLMQSDQASWAESFARHVMGNPDRPDLARQLATRLGALPPAHALTTLCAIFQSDVRAELPRVDQPVLVVHTRDDAAVPLEVAQYLHRHLRRSHLAIIEASGHLPHVSAPEEVILAMRQFLDTPVIR